jgi:hypothetical protein
VRAHDMCMVQTEATPVEQQSVTLILRLVPDARGRLQYDKAVDTEVLSQGRFVG